MIYDRGPLNQRLNAKIVTQPSGEHQGCKAIRSDFFKVCVRLDQCPRGLIVAALRCTHHGSCTVGRLVVDDRARFEALDLGIATLPPEDLGPVIDEPHASWMTELERAWTKRYAAQ